MLSVANMQGPGGAVPYVTFNRQDDVANSLLSIHVDEEHICEMRNNLTTGKSFSLPNVYLGDEELRKLGFYVLGNVPERAAAISAVEGLRLNSESVERLERTRDLRPEDRRAETIQAFVDSRNRE
jgi:hypothetical protein